MYTLPFSAKFILLHGTEWCLFRAFTTLITNSSISNMNVTDEMDEDGKKQKDVPMPKETKKQKNRIEKTYQKKYSIEHILSRPDSFIGSVKKVTEAMWIYDTEKDVMVQKQVEYVPGLYKIFDEILVNAAENKQRSKKMNCIKVEINAEDNLISVWNNGRGIPVVMHKRENMYVPTMIFGHYDDEEQKVTGGRNGYGAKLCNIFSNKFTVETGTKKYKRRFKQTWGSNMTKESDPKIKSFAGEDFTKITFSPDLTKFKMDKLDDDIIGLISRRVLDVAATTRGVKVFLNSKRVPVESFRDYIELSIKEKEVDDNNLKVAGMKKSRLIGIPKLNDANEAGTTNGLSCTLILTDGGSVAPVLSVVDRDYYGLFPLSGKLLNVREATYKQMLENAEINHLIQILGLQYKKKYNLREDMKSLRYGKLMIMTYQDQDGSHIKGSIINFIHYNWPELLKQDFLEQFITPIVKARKNEVVLSFYSMPEFEEWKANNVDQKSYSIKYYKGLGYFDRTEEMELFSNMNRHRIKFHYSGKTDDDHILLAFSKKHAEGRKDWLQQFMMESRRRKEIGLPETHLYDKNTKSVSITDFINKELVLFLNEDNVRSIPSLVDGLKPGQRKVLYVCLLKRNDEREIEVAQLVGSIMKNAAYHHGDAALSSTITNMAQDFVGSNNINLLEPKGQFGTRLMGGKDAGSPRYIFTKMSPLTRLLFHERDDVLLKHQYDGNDKIEPFWFIPILPMILVNGADGIGAGFKTKILNYNPRDIVMNLRRMLDGEKPKELVPWYKNFQGTIEYVGDHRYVISGEIAIIDKSTVEITELPIGTWTQHYKENVLEPMMHGSEKIKSVLSGYKNYSTDTTVKFVVSLQKEQMKIMNEEELHTFFKLQTIVNTNSMCAFDEYGVLKTYDSPLEILKKFFTFRLEMYGKRKEYWLGRLEAEASMLRNQANYIMEKCSGKLTVENNERKTAVDKLIESGYVPDPIQEWNETNKAEDDETQEPAEENQEHKANKKMKSESEKAHPDVVKKFDYLLGMPPTWMITDEKKNELLSLEKTKVRELEILRRKSNSDLWREDLEAFMLEFDKIEKKEKEDAAE